MSCSLIISDHDDSLDRDRQPWLVRLNHFGLVNQLKTGMLYFIPFISLKKRIQ